MPKKKSMSRPLEQGLEVGGLKDLGFQDLSRAFGAMLDVSSKLTLKHPCPGA